MPRLIPNYRPGPSRSRFADRRIEPEQPVVVVSREESLSFFGARDERELRDHLRKLRAMGLLVTRQRERLQAKVRTGTVTLPSGERRARRIWAYVVRASSVDEVPRIRGGGSAQLTRW